MHDSFNLIPLIGVLAIAFFALSIAAGTGAGILRLSRIHTSNPLETVLLSIGIGFPLVSYVLFGLGSFGWLNRSMALAVVAGFSLASLPATLELWNAMHKTNHKGLLKQFSRRVCTFSQTKLLVALIAILASLNLIGAMAPPTEWDSLDYHLSAVKYFINIGHITFVPYMNWASPMTAEMWNMLGLLLGSDRMPQIFQWAIGLGSAGALYLMAYSRTSHRTAVLATVFYYTSTHITYLSSSAKSDLAWLMFVFLSLHTLLKWTETKQKRWLVLSAVFTGLTLGTKVQGLFWAPGMGLLLLVMLLPTLRSAPIRVATCIGIYSTLSVLPGLPWWLRNWLASGDPIWPLGYPVFHSSYWTASLYERYAAKSHGPGDSLLQYFTGLWNLTLNQTAWDFGLVLPITPVLLTFLPCLLLLRYKVSRQIWTFFGIIVLPAIVYYSLWFNTYQQTRTALPFLAILMIPAAYSFWLLAEIIWTRYVGSVILVMFFLFFSAYNLVFNAQFAGVVLGLESREHFLAKKVKYYADIRWLNDNLPENARVLFYPMRTYYIDKTFVQADSAWFQQRNTGGEDWLWDNITTPESYINLLRDRGITHVFISTPVVEVWVNTDLAIKELKLRGDLKTIYVNHKAVFVESRTLSQTRPVRVEILEVD